MDLAHPDPNRARGLMDRAALGRAKPWSSAIALGVGAFWCSLVLAHGGAHTSAGIMSGSAAVPSGELQQAEHLAVIGQTGGAAQAVAAFGDYAGVGIGTRMVVFDLSQPSAPRPLARTAPLDAIVTGIAVVEPLIYVGHGTSLLILDATSPSNLITVSHTDYHLMDSIRRMVVADGYAYLLLNSLSPSGVAVIDVRDPREPRRIGTDPWFLVNAGDIAVAGGRLYIVTSNLLRIMDVADPARPVEIGQFHLGASARGLAASGSHVYSTTGSGLKVIDVSDPSNPQLVGTLPIVGSRVAIHGDFIYIAEADQGVRVVSISDGRRPEHVAWLPTQGRVSDLAPTSKRLLATVDGFGLYVASGEQPSELRHVGTHQTFSGAADIVVREGRAYVAARDTCLAIVDVTDPEETDTIGVLGPQVQCQHVALDGDLAFLASGERVYAIDVSQPLTPTIKSSVVTAGPDTPVAASRGLLLVADNAAPALIAFDVADPLVPRRLDALSTLGWEVTDLELRAGYAYVADRSFGLRVVDIADPQNLRVAGTLAFDGSEHQSHGLVVLGDRAYVVGRGNWSQATSSSDLLTAAHDEPLPPPPPPPQDPVLRLDVSDPGAPRLIDSLGASGWPKGLAVADDRLYIASGFASYYSTQLLLRSATTGAEVFALHLPTVPRAVAAAGDTAYVAAGDAGLIVARVIGGAEPTPTRPTPDIRSRALLPIAWARR